MNIWNGTTVNYCYVFFTQFLHFFQSVSIKAQVPLVNFNVSLPELFLHKQEIMEFRVQISCEVICAVHTHCKSSTATGKLFMVVV